MASSSNNLNRGSGVPRLVIDPNDVTGSWKTWLDEFEIYVELKEVEMGTKTLQVEGERREVALFTPRNKLLTLLKAIGKKLRVVVLR